MDNKDWESIKCLLSSFPLLRLHRGNGTSFFFLRKKFTKCLHISGLFRTLCDVLEKGRQRPSERGGEARAKRCRGRNLTGRRPTQRGAKTDATGCRERRYTQRQHNPHAELDRHKETTLLVILKEKVPLWEKSEKSFTVHTGLVPLCNLMKHIGRNWGTILNFCYLFSAKLRISEQKKKWLVIFLQDSKH